MTLFESWRNIANKLTRWGIRGCSLTIHKSRSCNIKPHLSRGCRLLGRILSTIITLEWGKMYTEWKWRFSKIVLIILLTYTISTCQYNCTKTSKMNTLKNNNWIRLFRTSWQADAEDNWPCHESLWGWLAWPSDMLRYGCNLASCSVAGTGSRKTGSRVITRTLLFPSMTTSLWALGWVSRQWNAYNSRTHYEPNYWWSRAETLIYRPI